MPPHQCSVLLADIAMMSAAVDGIEVAEAVALSMVGFQPDTGSVGLKSNLRVRRGFAA